MRQVIILCLLVTSLFALSACQQRSNGEDTGKIQEAIEKIKSKVQDNLAKEEKVEEEESKKEATTTP